MRRGPFNSKPDVLRWEAEFGAGEDEGGALGVVAGVGAHRMHVAPGALDRVVEKEGVAAAGLEQAVDGGDAALDRLA